MASEVEGEGEASERRPRVPPATIRVVPGAIGLHPGLYYTTHKGLEERELGLGMPLNPSRVIY